MDNNFLLGLKGRVVFCYKSCCRYNGSHCVSGAPVLLLADSRVIGQLNLLKSGSALESIL